MSNMLTSDLARSMAADRDRYIAARDLRGPAPARESLRVRFAAMLRRMRREVAVVAPAIVTPIVLAIPEAVAVDDVA